MHVSTVNGLVALLSATLTGAFQVNVYSDTSCGSYVTSLTGTNDGTDGTNFDEGGQYIGSLIVVDEDDWTTQVTLDDNCLWYDQICASGAPSCTYYGQDGTDGYGSNASGCLVADTNVNNINVGFTICDEAGFDASYRRNVTAKTFRA